MIRTAQHYRKMMQEGPDTTVGTSLAAAAVYAARYGVCEAEDRDSAAYRQVHRDLLSRYGEYMSSADVLAEMDAASQAPEVTLTTDHPASSYGMPVLLVGATPYGPGDALPTGETAAAYVGRWSLDPSRTDEERDLARRFVGLGPALLLAAGDIAQLAGVTTDAVHQWAKRYPEFRGLAVATSTGLIWRRDDVERWLRETGRLR